MKRGSAARWALGLGVLGAVALAAFLAFGQDSPTPARAPSAEARAVMAPGHAGNEACARCHAEITTAHGETGHARTLARVTASWPDVPPSDWKRDPVLPLLMRVVRRGATIGVESRAGDVLRWQPAHWAFGSGKHGVTLVAEAGAGRYAELPLSYYPGRGWDLTPGYLANTPERRMFHAAGVPADYDLFLECFQCHATGVKAGAADIDFGPLRMGLHCERCHGPGAAHVRAAELKQPLHGTIRSPRSETAAGITRLCGECHRTEPPPGIGAESPLLVRFAPVGLQRSRCYVESKGRLSCVSCHDPHRDVDTRPEKTEAVCRSCHTGATPAATCPVNPKQGCVGCHMPKAEAVRNSHFTDHWIRVRPERRAPAPAQSPTPAVPFGH